MTNGINRIFALIIGINDYKNRPKLVGAVHDADDVNDFIVNSLGAHEDDIINLRDWEEESRDPHVRRGPATRANIIAQLQSLRENPAIRKGDPILIYFAGHGAQSQAEVWRNEFNDGYLESLCPVDIGSDEDGEGEVPAIPDYTLRALINELSIAKGNNITLILDCSYCAELYAEEISGERLIVDPPVLRPELDDHLTSGLPTGLIKVPGFLGQDLLSHVCLAACSTAQRAREIHGRGVFTKALTEVLGGSRGSQLTYTQLIQGVYDKISDKSQTPVLCGVNAYRQLFRSDTGDGDAGFISGLVNESGEFIIRVGDTLGIELGAQFDIYSNNLADTSNLALGTLIVTDSSPLSSTLRHLPDSDFSVPPVFYAKTRLISLGIYAAENTHRVVEGILSEYGTLERAAIRWPDSPERSDIRLEVKGNRVILHRCSQEFDQDIISVVGSRIGYTMSKDEPAFISESLKGLSHFNHQLRFKGSMDVSQIGLRFYGVSFEEDGFDYTVVPNEDGENIIENDTIDITVYPDDDKQYALTIQNDGGQDLYPFLFYFDASTYEIDCWYAPENHSYQTSAEAPLKSNSKLDIGFGSGRDTPRKFVLNSSDDVEMGYLKLFLSTSPASLDFMDQDSPFESKRMRLSLRGFVESPNQPNELWGTKVVRMIQRRPPSED